MKTKYDQEFLNEIKKYEEREKIASSIFELKFIPTYEIKFIQDNLYLSDSEMVHFYFDHCEKKNLVLDLESWTDFKNKMYDLIYNDDNSEQAWSDLDQVIGVDEASDLWNLSPGHIKNLCAEDKLIAKKIGNTWILSKNQNNPKMQK